MVLPLQLLDVTDSRAFATTTACTTTDIQAPLPSPARVAFSGSFCPANVQYNFKDENKFKVDTDHQLDN